MADERQTPNGAAGTVQADPRRWKALIVLALIQFMLVLGYVHGRGVRVRD
jgi:hypothetical protein